MTFGSLFAGIGGLDKGLEDAGLQCSWQVEINPYCQKVLTAHWPTVPKHLDITTIKGSDLPYVDLIAGGFPCQDISVAGKGAGLSGERSGLWYHMLRLIKEVCPKYVLIENVAALRRRGLNEVLAGLAEAGFDAEWRDIRASDVGAPHQRERLFILAHPREERVQRCWPSTLQRFPEFSWCQDVRGIEDLRSRSDIPTSLFRGSRDGVPNWVDRIAACGNAIIPRIPQLIGEHILQHEQQY